MMSQTLLTTALLLLQPQKMNVVSAPVISSLVFDQYPLVFTSNISEAQLKHYLRLRLCNLDSSQLVE